MEPAPRIKRTRVCILESLRPADERTGHQLFQRLLPRASTDPGSLGVGFCEATDRPTFDSALREVADWSRGEDVDPALHVEAHGSEAGLSLGNDDLIPWSEFGELLIPIMEASRGELFVVLAACNTVPVVRTFVPTRRAPFRRMIVSSRIVLPSEVVGAFVAFYETLNETKDARASLRAMNDMSEAFGYLDSSMIVRDVLNSYVAMSKDENYIQKRARDVVDERVMRGEIPIADRSKWIEELLAGYRQDPVALFRSNSDEYFWLDKFPERREGFERDFAAIAAGVPAAAPSD